LVSNIKSEQLGKKIKDKWVFRHIDFEVTSGEALFIEGPNGAGKSVLLQTLAGFWKGNEGSLTIQQNTSKDIAYCPFHAGLDEFMKLKDSLIPWIGKNNCIQALEHWGLSDWMFKRVNSLSSGQHKRALLARTFFMDSNILLLDEPFIGLDQTYRSLLLTSIKEKLDKGHIIIFTGHHVDLGDSFQPKTLEMQLTK